MKTPELNCTCGEPPNTGHFLWCDALRGRPEYQPRKTEAIAVSLLAKPLRREVMACGDAWLWHVTARESVSGALVEVGHFAGQAADVPRLSKELASAAPHGYHVFAVIVEPTP